MSGAAGAVGSVVGQIAKLKGNVTRHRVYVSVHSYVYVYLCNALPSLFIRPLYMLYVLMCVRAVILTCAGCRVVGTVGSQDKIDYIVNELGFDAGTPLIYSDLLCVYCVFIVSLL